MGCTSPMRRGGWGLIARASVVALVVTATLTTGLHGGADRGHPMAGSGSSAPSEPQIIGAAALTSDGGATGRRSPVQVARGAVPRYRVDPGADHVRVAPRHYRAVRIQAASVRRALAGTPEIGRAHV